MKRFSIVIIAIIMAMVTGVTAEASVDARAAIMVDARSGQVIYQQDADKKLPIASISKLLTMAVIYDELHSGKITGNTKVKVTKPIAEVSNDPDYSAIGLKKGNSYTVNELMKAAMIKSADGATLALATADGGTVKQFNSKMKQKAHQIGMKDVEIVNPVGLTNDQLKGMRIKGIAGNAENKMSAEDVAILSRYLVRREPQLLKITSQKQANFKIAKGNVKNENNLNQMLPGSQYTVPKVQINGLKTGTSDKAGACFASSGRYQNRQIITVILHANGSDKDNRFRQTQALYRMLGSKYNLRYVAIPAKIVHYPIASAKKKTVTLRPSHMPIWQERQTGHDYQFGTTLRSSVTKHNGQLVAPLKKGERVGKVTISGDHLQSLDGKPITTPQYSRENVKKLNWLQRLFN